MTNKIKMTPRGYLAEDPRGLCVKMVYQGRELLGKIRGFKFNEVRGYTALNITYFNGDQWPIEPSPYTVEII